MQVLIQNLKHAMLQNEIRLAENQKRDIRKLHCEQSAAATTTALLFLSRLFPDVAQLFVLSYAELFVQPFQPNQNAMASNWPYESGWRQGTFASISSKFAIL